MKQANKNFRPSRATVESMEEACFCLCSCAPHYCPCSYSVEILNFISSMNDDTPAALNDVNAMASGRA